MGGKFRCADGQVLVVVALAMPLVIAFAGLALDGSIMLVDRRGAQNAADVAALAAADELGPARDPSCLSTCLATVESTAAAVAQSYIAKNNVDSSSFHECHGASDTNCYTYPYRGNDARIEVRVHETGAAFFARVAGFHSFDVNARAVAIAKSTVHVNPGHAIAIFAYVHNGIDPCGGTDANGVPYGITIEGNPQDSIDAVLSNGIVTMNSKGHVGWAGYGPPPKNCARAGSRQGNVATWAQQPSVIDWPRKFDRTAVCVGHDSGSARSLNSPADGIYCSNVSITVTHLSGSHALTLVAPIVNVPQGSGNNNFVLTPYNAGLDAANKDLVVWQYASGQQFTIGGNNSAFDGVVWNQNGTLTYDGNSGVTGFYEAQSVWVPGNTYTMTGSGPSEGASTTVTGTTANLDE